MDERTEYYCFAKNCNCYFTKGKAAEGTTCPNCNNNLEVLSCDTFDFVRIIGERKDRKLRDKSWTKPAFVSEEVLKRYRDEGIKIVE